MKQYFTKKEALERIIETLGGGYDDYYQDLHNEVFNTDYYIIYRDEAKQALNQYGVFEAIEEVQEFEESMFGYVESDLRPERIANILWYIIGDEVISEIQPLQNLLDEYATEENNQLIINWINENL